MISAFGSCIERRVTHPNVNVQEQCAHGLKAVIVFFNAMWSIISTTSFLMHFSPSWLYVLEFLNIIFHCVYFCNSILNQRFKSTRMLVNNACMTKSVVFTMKRITWAWIWCAQRLHSLRCGWDKLSFCCNIDIKIDK